jgi:hypothetical protein
MNNFNLIKFFKINFNIKILLEFYNFFKIFSKKKGKKFLFLNFKLIFFIFFIFLSKIFFLINFYSGNFFIF